jgi:hypothetical protein
LVDKTIWCGRHSAIDKIAGYMFRDGVTAGDRRRDQIAARATYYFAQHGQAPMRPAHSHLGAWSHAKPREEGSENDSEPLQTSAH